MKRFIFLFIVLSCCLSCNSDIIIVYENDVHCNLNGYAPFAGIRDSIRNTGKKVYTVSSGDFLSGGMYGNANNGRYIVDMMNCVGYDVVTIGNHEFDFGIDTLVKRTEELNCKIVCSNFKYKGKLIYDSYYMDGEVAFIGVTTPTALTTSSPKNFTDSNGKLICDFYPDILCDLVQEKVNEAKKNGAEYVVLLSHLGNSLNPILTSTQLISKTHGIDAVIDGHEHNVIGCDSVINSIGKPVILTSTGAYFNNVGVMTISNGNIKSEVKKCNSIQLNNHTVDSCYKSIITDFSKTIGERYIGKTPFDLTIMDKSGTKRAVRCSETNLGDLITDAFRFSLNSDIAIVNSGSIRGSIEKGDINYSDIFSVCPFENHISKIETTGQTILDVLEMSSTLLPKEYGGFMQVSGIRYEVDTNIESPIRHDSIGIQFMPENSVRRVKNVMICDQGEYSEIEPDKKYTISGSDFILFDHGDGIYFREYKKIATSEKTDVQIIADYISDSLNGIVANKYSRPDSRIKIKLTNAE